MKSTLYWSKPASEEQILCAFGEPLRGILLQRYLGQNGAIEGRFKLHSDDLPFVDQIAEAGVTGADLLARDLRLYGSLDLSTSISGSV